MRTLQLGLLGGNRTRLLLLVALAVVAAGALAVSGGVFTSANQVAGARSGPSAAAPSAGGVRTIAPVKIVYHAARGYREVTGPGFATEYPAGWRHEIRHLTVKGIHGVTYAFVSGRRLPDAVGIPAAGQVALNMEIYPVASMVKDDPHQATQTPAQFLLYNVGFPKGFTRLGRVSPDSASVLDGAPAATLAVSYVYRGVANVQIDTVAGTAARSTSWRVTRLPPGQARRWRARAADRRLAVALKRRPALGAPVVSRQ